MIYIFDLLEFQVLAAAKGMERYYGFPAAGEQSREQICLSVYRLAKAGILKQEDHDMVIQPPVAGYMEVIASAELVLVVDSGRYRLPRQCIYVCCDGAAGETGYICLENSRTDSEEICLSEMNREDCFRQMQDLNQLPLPHLEEEIGQYDFEGYWDRQMPSGLWEQLKGGLEPETETLLETEPVHSVFTLRNKESGTIKERLVLLDFALEYCMVRQTPDGLQMCRYRRKDVQRILETWWRDER